MLGMFHLLPLLKGWEYSGHRLKGWVKRGGKPLELSVRETGWLLEFGELTTDCYGKVKLEFQGAGLQTNVLEVCPQTLYDIGAFMQDPSGWISLYKRPNPYSTAGIFAITFSAGMQGAILPYVPTVRLTAWLSEESTQEAAYIEFVALVVKLTNVKAFIRSLRRVLQAKADLWIDPALLTVGPVEFKEASEK